MNRRYVVYVHTSPHFEPTELFVFADSPEDAVSTVGYMVKKLGGDMSNAIKVTAELDD